MLLGIYGAVVLVYLVLGGDSDLGSPLTSAAKLMIPVVLTLAGYGALRNAAALRRFGALTAILALASTLFGMWDIGNTAFWTDMVDLGNYLYSVKNVVTGYDPQVSLPFNFFGFEEARRAGGLVAAPLAQGSLVATGGLLAFALLRRRHLGLAVLALAVCTIGVYQSGTRGAMLMMAVAMVLYLTLAWRSGRELGVNVMLLAVGALMLFNVAAAIVSYTVNLEDGSTIGHLDALRDNFSELGDVVLFGRGLGMAGPVAGSAGMEIGSGSESTLFSIIYQVGLPAGLLFLAFYGMALLRLFARRRDGEDSDMMVMVAALLVGAATTLIASDHLISLSAMAPLWLLTGGALALAGKAEKTKAAP